LWVFGFLLYFSIVSNSMYIFLLLIKNSIKGQVGQRKDINGWGSGNGRLKLLTQMRFHFFVHLKYPLFLCSIIPHNHIGHYKSDRWLRENISAQLKKGVLFDEMWSFALEV
jgi:hypothetical protein